VIGLAWTGLMLAWGTLAAVVLVGLGRLVRLLLPPAGGDGTGPPAFWLGLAGCLAFLQLWHLLLPVDGRAALVLLGIGLAGFRWGRGPAVVARPGTYSMALLLLIPAVVVLANRALGAATVYDSGLYHFASVRWATDYAVVPGLGNLHARLAFNQSYFLLVAALDHPLPGLDGHRLVNGILYVALLAELVRPLPRSLRGGVTLNPSEWLRVLLLVPVAHAAAHNAFSSPVPDTAVLVLGYVLVLVLADALWSVDARARTHAAAALWVLGAAAVTVKLSMLAWAGAAAVMATVAARPARAGPSPVRCYAGAAVAAAVLLTAWVLRGLVQSGYPLFPATLGGIGVDWAVPPAHAAAASAEIRTWAREPFGDPEVVLSTWRWVRGWSGPAIHALGPPLLVTLSGLLVLVRKRPARGSAPGRLRGWLPLWIHLAAVALFWFATAPDPRFLYGAPWVAAALAWLPVVLALSVAERARRGWPFAAAAVLVLALLGVVRNPFTRVWFAAPQPTRTVPVDTFTTSSGLQLLVPERADSTAWDAPLPNTPHPRSALELRGAGLGQGFRIR